MSAHFWAEELTVPIEIASKIAWFMEFTKRVHAIERATPWAKHGFARVYVELWSQNKLQPCMGIGKMYFDALDGNFLFFNDFAGEIRGIEEIPDYPKNWFSGAKTRKSLIEMCEAYCAEKIS